jgi:hypothetical protein
LPGASQPHEMHRSFAVLVVVSSRGGAITPGE